MHEFKDLKLLQFDVFWEEKHIQNRRPAALSLSLTFRLPGGTCNYNANQMNIHTGGWREGNVQGQFVMCVCVQLSVCPQEKVVLQRRSESCVPQPHIIFTISCQEELAMGVFHYSLNQKHSGQSESVWPVKLLHRSLPELLPSF